MVKVTGVLVHVQMKEGLQVTWELKSQMRPIENLEMVLLEASLDFGWPTTVCLKLM